jgi:peptide/nickel transport system substrate-binding protein
LIRSLPIAATLAACLLIGGCDRRDDSGPVVASAIGASPALTDPNDGMLDQGSREMLDSTAQGLVRFDAFGQIEPGLAERWIVIDDGMSYIFRLRPAQWSDGAPVTAAQVVAGLRRAITNRSRNAMAPYLTAVDEIVEMTPEVIEVRLARPRPDLLKLFAQPDMAIVDGRRLKGSGPFRIVTARRDTVLLRPALNPEDTDARKSTPQEDVLLIGERASRAIARFAARDSDLVSGGTFTDWPILAAASVAPANIRIDPAAGLFGLAVVRREGLLADPAGRSAIAQAIDRPALLGAFTPGWTATETILPEQLDSSALPTVPQWSTLPLEQRRTAARATVAAWRAAHAGAAVQLRLSLPAGPGSTLLFAYLAASLRAVGVDLLRVATPEPADLALVDAVAPFDSARWYLASACLACGVEAMIASEAARVAPTLAERSARIADTDRLLTQDAAFIPIARPLRWSLVALRLAQWQGNSRAWHPLNRLRTETK